MEHDKRETKERKEMEKEMISECTDCRYEENCKKDEYRRCYIDEIRKQNEWYDAAAILIIVTFFLITIYVIMWIGKQLL